MNRRTNFKPCDISANCRWLLLSVALTGSITLLSGGRASAATIVAPGSAATSEGNANNTNAFSIANDSFIPSDTQRYQQIYSSSLFSAVPSGGGFITELLFRPDGPFGSAFSSTLPDIRIDLSTTKSSETTYSNTFANNVGSDDTIVYGGPAGSALTLSSADSGPYGGPKDFDITINLTKPFFYNPANGGLLLDVRDFSGATTTIFDAVNTAGDGISSIFTNANGVNAATSNVADTIGFVTEFAFVPEPSSCLVLIPLLLGLSVRRKRPR